MNFLPKSILNLIEEFSKLPGVGPKSAQRLTMHLLHSPQGRVSSLSDAVSGLHRGLEFCSSCWNISESPLCKICSDQNRNHHQICVVEEILDVVALEKTMEYKGTYHVLHGSLSPVDGIGPEQLKIEALINRIKTSAAPAEIAGSGDSVGRPHRSLAPQVEIILATNPGLEGETTAMYIMRLLKPFQGTVKVTRIARGLPVGGDLDYADELTLVKAMQGRAEYI